MGQDDQRYRVRYLHAPTGETARYYPMSKSDALECARQLLADGEQEVMIEDHTGHAVSIHGMH